MENSAKKLLCILALTAAFLAYFSTVLAATPEELKKSIEEKSKQLSEINGQIQETQKNIQSAEEKGKTLKQEIKKNDYLISQLNLSIKSSQIKIDKLGLEIESLSYDIDSKEKHIDVKKEAVSQFLRQLEEKSRENTLVIFLRNRSLADSIFEAESINSLSAQLSVEIDELLALKSELSEKLSETAAKKGNIEQENKTLKSRKNLTEEQKSDRQELLKTTKNQEKLYQEQLKALEKQQQDIASEIEEIEHELRKRIDPNLLPLPRPGVFAWPTGSNVRLSQGYGQTEFARYSYKGKYHNGVDIAGPLGTEIYAAEDGEVIAVGNQDLYCRKGAYGKYAVIRHDNGLTTLYAHLSQYTAQKGQKVARGGLIGYMGKTGYATGSHLHFTVWSTATYLLRDSRVCGLMPVGGDLDPMKYLASQPQV